MSLELHQRIEEAERRVRVEGFSLLCAEREVAECEERIYQQPSAAVRSLDREFLVHLQLVLHRTRAAYHAAIHTAQKLRREITQK